MEYETIIYTKEENIGIITLNRPRQMNALDRKLCQEIEEIMEQMEKDEEIRVIIITGVNRFFSAGADISEAVFLIFSVSGAYNFSKR